MPSPTSPPRPDHGPRRPSRRRIARTASAGLLAALLALAGCSAPLETSVRPGINDVFLAADLDVDAFVEAFETESREIAAERDGIVATLDLRAGLAVADIGAGTGLFLEPLAREVGPHGRVYAVDIAPELVGFMRERAEAAGWSQVRAVLCTERSVGLPSASIDVAFVCDTYHHFEYPQTTLASLHDALRPGGTLVVVDFEREPGVSRDWVLDHVRAGRAQVLREIEAAGFLLDSQPQVPGLHENYVLRFHRP